LRSKRRVNTMQLTAALKLTITQKCISKNTKQKVYSGNKNNPTKFANGRKVVKMQAPRHDGVVLCSLQRLYCTHLQSCCRRI